MGSLVNRDSKPIKGMTAEIWQTDMNGVYLHTGSFGSKMRDVQFQGFGRSITDQNGHFSFRTIIPAEYPGRTPHIHLKLLNGNENVLTTQLYIQGHPLNKEDFLFKRMTLAEQNINSMELLPTQDINFIPSSHILVMEQLQPIPQKQISKDLLEILIFLLMVVIHTTVQIL